MFRLSTIRRRLLLGAGYVLVLSGLTLTGAHTSLVRRFVLVQLQTRLGNTTGLVINAKSLDYNLLAGRFELHDLSIRGARLQDMPAPLQVQRIAASIPVWRLLRGSFQSAQIRIDGLSLCWLMTRDGRSNLPVIPMGREGGGKSGGPSVLVSGGNLSFQDDRNGLRAQLAIGQIAADWRTAKSEYAIRLQGGGGRVVWNNAQFAVDRLLLQSTLASSGVTVESAQLSSGPSEVELMGTISGTAPPRIQASASLNFDLDHVGRGFAWNTPLRGRVLARLSAAGLLQSPLIGASIEGQNVAVKGIPVLRPTIRATFDAAAGAVDVRELAVSLFSGDLRGRGRISIDGGRSKFTAAARAVDLRQAGLPFGRTSLDLTASAPGLEWRRATAAGVARLGFAQVAFHAAGTGNSVRASVDSRLSDAGTIRGDVAIGLSGKELSGTVNGKIDSLSELTADLEQLLGRPTGTLIGTNLDGTATWSAILSGTALRPAASVQLDARNLSAGNWTGGNLALQAGYAPDRIAVESARVVWGGQQLDLKGEVGGASPNAPLNLEGTIRGDSLAGVFHNLGTEPSAEAPVSGKLSLRGTLSQPEAEASLQAANVTVFGQTFSRASIDASWQRGEITLSRLAAEQDGENGAPGRVDANGCLTPATGAYEVDLTGRNLRQNVTLAKDLPLSGTFQIEAHGKGTLADPALAAEVSASGVRVGSTELGSLNAKIEALDHRATARLSVPALNLKASSTLAMEGAWPFDITLDAQRTRLETSPPISFDAAATVTGTLSGPRVDRATANIQNLQVDLPQQAIRSDGPIDLTYAAGILRFGQLALKSGQSSLRASGSLPVQEGAPAGSVSIQGTIDLAPLSALLPKSAQSRVGGTVDISATIDGTLENWQPAGSLAIRDGHFDSTAFPLPLDGLTGTVLLENGTVRANQLTGKAGTGTLRLDASAPFGMISPGIPGAMAAAGQPARFSARLDKLEFSGTDAERPLAVKVDATIEGEAKELSIPALHATAELTNLDIKAAKTNLKQASPTRVTVAEGVARLEKLEIQGPGSVLRISGSLGLGDGSPIQLEAAGGTDLSLLSLVASPLDASGALKLDLRVAGTLDAPRTTGFLELEQATFALPNPPLRGRNINLRAEADGEHVSLKRFEGNLNGGTFQGGGELNVGTAGLHDVNLFLKGKDTFSSYPASIKTTSSIDARLVSRDDRLVLEGQVEVQEGYLESTLDLFSSTNAIPETDVNATRKVSSKPTALDFKIVTKRPVEMDNNLGRISARADLRLGGNVQTPRLTGNLELEEDGRLYFGDRTYYIDRGTVDFLDAPRVTPDLNVRAYTRTGDYTIWLGLRGTPDELTTTFTSDPPLSRDDVISVLLTGKTVSENRGVDLRALEATTLATGALNASLSSQLRRTVGVSRVSIQPAAIAAESNPGARVTITQDFTRSLRLLYSMNLQDSNDQIWVGEYDLSRHFTTRAVKQSDNTYRGEFRHDVRFGSSNPNPSSTQIRNAPQKLAAVRFAGAEAFPQEQLAKIFKVRAGRQYNSMKVRKGADRLSKFLAKRGYLESRVRLDRQNAGPDIDLTVRIEPGPVVQIAFEGVHLPGKQQARVRNAWRSGISDQQRPQAAKDTILTYLAGKGYLRAAAESKVSGDAQRKHVVFDVRPGTQYRDVKIVIEGADRRRAKELDALVHREQIKQSVYRDPARMIEALTRYYRQRGYLAAKVSAPVYRLDNDHRTGRIAIPIQEGPVFHVGALEFSGNHALSGGDLSAGLPLAAGIVFEPGRVDPTLAALKLKYGKLGYREADIDYTVARHDDTATVDVSFIVDEKQQTSIAAVQVEGNRHTSREFALGQLKIAPGQVADTEKIRESVKNLSQTGAYSSTDIQVRPVSESVATDKPVHPANLVVGVSEPRPFRLLYGGLYDSGGGPGFIADLQNHNSFGAGRVLGLRTRVDPETDEIRLYLTQPTWRTRRLSTTFATYYTRETEDYQTTPTEKLGFSLQQDLQLRSKFLFSYGYRYERQRGFVPDPAAPDIPQSIVAVAPVTITISRDARDSFLDATRGSFLSHGFELAPKFLGSDYPYVRYYVQYFKYFPLLTPHPVPFGDKPRTSRLVFATGSRLGLQKGFNSTGAVLTDRFYAGGGTTVRGFRQDELGPKLANGQPAGGNAVLVLNEELRYPLFWVFDAVTFVDVGNVFPRVNDFRFSDLRSAGGFGLRIRNPFVVLRFDYGFKFGRRPGESRGAFFFSIGQAF